MSVDLSLPIRRCPESGAQMRNQRQHLGGDAPGMGIGNEDRCRLCFRADIQQQLLALTSVPSGDGPDHEKGERRNR